MTLTIEMKTAPKSAFPGCAEAYAKEQDGPENVVNIETSQISDTLSGDKCVVSPKFVDCAAVILHNDDDKSGKLFHVDKGQQQDHDKCGPIANANVKYVYVFGAKWITSGEDALGTAVQEGCSAEERFDHRGKYKMSEVYYKPKDKKVVLFTPE